MSFVVTIEAMLAQARKEGASLQHYAVAYINKLQRGLWQRKNRPGHPIDLVAVKDLTDVEFALWALRVAESTVDGVDADQVGRMVACGLARVVLDQWLPEAVMLTDCQIGPGYTDDLFLDLAERRRPIGDWHDWLRAVQGLIDTTEDRGYESAVRLAALSSAKSMVVPSNLRRPPARKALETQGRFCAHAAYFDACWAWATAHEGYRAAHRIADIARPHADESDLNDIDAHLSELQTSLLNGADTAVEPWANAIFKRCVVEFGK